MGMSGMIARNAEGSDILFTECIVTIFEDDVWGQVRKQIGTSVCFHGDSQRFHVLYGVKCRRSAA